MPPAVNKSGLVKFIKVNSCLLLSIQERICSLSFTGEMSLFWLNQEFGLLFESLSLPWQAYIVSAIRNGRYFTGCFSIILRSSSWSMKITSSETVVASALWSRRLSKNILTVAIRRTGLPGSGVRIVVLRSCLCFHVKAEDSAPHVMPSAGRSGWANT